MQQLSWTDDLMLRGERPETPMHIQMLLIDDPSSAPGGKVTFKGILEELEARLHLAPTFRPRLTELPGGMHMPCWWMTQTSTSNITCAISRCLNLVTGANCASRWRGFMRDNSASVGRPGRSLSSRALTPCREYPQARSRSC